MNTHRALASVTLAAAAAAVLLTPEPTLAALNDVVSIEAVVSAWSPAPETASTAATSPQATAPVADDPFTPLIEPVPAGEPAGPDVVSPPPEPTPAEQEPSPGPGPSAGTEPADETAQDPSDGPEPTVVPESGTTASPAEEAPSATGTGGVTVVDGAASGNALTSDG